MPRIRHRMRSRRGSSRGREIFHQSSFENDTPSEDVACGHIPETRSKRGRASQARQGHSTHGSQPLHFASTLQPVSQFAAPPVAFRHTSQQAEFQFVCYMDCLVLTAFINVSLQEEATSSKTFEKPASQPPLAHDKTVYENVSQDLTREDKAQHQEKGATATATCATTDEDDSSSVEYRCRVVEEHPPPGDDQ